MLRKAGLFLGCVLCGLGFSGSVYMLIMSFRGGMVSFSDVLFYFILIGGMTCVGTLVTRFCLPVEKQMKAMQIGEGVLLFAYLVILFELVFGGFRLYALQFENHMSFLDSIRTNANFIPFKTIFYYMKNFFTNEINVMIGIENLVGNFCMFMPAALFLPAFFQKQRRWKSFLITMSIILVGIEGIQLFLHLGGLDIDDVILNLAGASLVYGIFYKKKVQERLIEWKVFF